MMSYTFFVCIKKCPSKGDSMTYQQAKELVKERAASKYRGTALHLLQKLTNSLYSEQDKNADVEKKVVSKKAATMCGWLGIGDKQLGRLLDEVEEVHIVSRENGTVTYTMKLQPLKSAEKTITQAKRLKKERNADRTKKARDQRKVLREAEEFRGNVREALYLDLADFAIKSALLKDVPEGEAKRHMMTWDVDKIRRDKANAEQLLKEANL
jgi:hypothetical protein